MIYNEGDALNLTGLVVTLTKKDGQTEDVSYTDFATKGIGVDLVNGTVLTPSHNKVTITANGKTAEQVISVIPSNGSTFPLMIGQTINTNRIVKQSSPIEFTFADDPDWRAAIISVKIVTPGYPDTESVNMIQKNPGKISFRHPNHAYYGLGFWTWTIKATGYPDTIVTVEVRP